MQEGGLGEKGYRYKKKFLGNLPIPRPTKETEQKIANLLDRKDYKKIDLLVYEMYGLNEEERKLIENSLG